MNNRVTVLRPDRDARAAGDPRSRGLPRLPRGYVPPRAVERLAAEPLPPLTVLQCPRAFGKTAAISWLLRGEEDPRLDIVWVNLPHRAVERDELWETVARRLRDAALEEDDWAALDRSLARRRRRLVLVVDDLDRVESTTVDAELGELVSQHEQIHVITMMRQPRPIHLHAVQLDGVVLHSDDLRLDADDTLQMADKLGHEISPSTAEQLTEQVRGWPALLRIVMSEPIQVVGSQVQIDQGLVDRFIRMLLTDLPDPGIRRLLQVVSVPETLPPELVHDLIGGVTWERVAGFLEDLGLGTDAAGQRTGSHPIRMAAATMLAEDDPEAFREISRKSAEWFSARDAPAMALRHAVAAQEWHLVADLLERNWALLLAERPTLMRDALESLPTEVIGQSAHLIVARDYILNIATEDRARSAYVSGLLIPQGAALARSRRRLSLREVLRLHSTGLYDVTHSLVESRDLASAIAESGWSDDVVRTVPRLLLEWGISNLFDAPGVGAPYAFVEAAEWADQVGDDVVRREAAAGAALSHTVIGYPVAGQAWLDLLESLPESSEAVLAPTMEAVARTMLHRQVHGVAGPEVGSEAMPPELADLEVLVVGMRADNLLREGRSREAIRLLESYRVQPPETSAVSLVEQFLVATRVESYLASNQVERARRLLLEVDPDGARHPGPRALVSFQSGEYSQVLDLELSDDLVPRQTVKVSLLRACSALRLQQRAVALDAFQTAVSTATQTGMVRPFLMMPQADLIELAGQDVEVANLLARLDGHTGLLPEPQDGSGLSPRELQVLEVVSSGASFAAVASRLFVSPNTVKSQMRDIYRKLNVRGRDHAVERARELGLLRR
ncbi:LuxR C-terminal-related transcriptional regulator [Pseudactinotalea terrae]|uniref:LuxR C-terminal-related transcriptional regulator n=1 Tax=Pseudactinotalea terrae TaxID=1743262 RepID=UPI0012E265DD|nr:LuxR C-terminal-related transcriptional regulator [Pseudactinotalea terrae]